MVCEYDTTTTSSSSQVSLQILVHIAGLCSIFFSLGVTGTGIGKRELTKWHRAVETYINHSYSPVSLFLPIYTQTFPKTLLLSVFNNGCHSYHSPMASLS